MKTLFKYLNESHSEDKKEFKEFWDKNSTSDKEDFFTEMRSSDIKRYNEIADIKAISTLIETRFNDWPKEVQDIVISYYEKD
ncbi:hypothetical protein [Dysgonomonas sp. 520]|uniref:hypothetical protein n=1 Tax=Dysgonomonas sp. 520 TaxID=2302931 RepID=UPI0013D1C31A|nr:hypothetical protein [Dysgonomonas sp. 520]NDW11158.1 hypothetical protein [Dysgonomonas sp. 520]